MTENDRQHDQDGRRQEFRLPVLKRLEPQLCVEQIIAGGLNGSAVPERLFVCRNQAFPPVEGKGNYKQQRERYPQ